MTAPVRATHVCTPNGLRVRDEYGRMVCGICGHGFYMPGDRRCPVHVSQVEPCPTCQAYIAAGL